MKKAEKYGMYFMETSAKRNTNVHELFNLAAEEAILRYKEGRKIKGVRINDYVVLQTAKNNKTHEECWL